MLILVGMYTLVKINVVKPAVQSTLMANHLGVQNKCEQKTEASHHFSPIGISNVSISLRVAQQQMIYPCSLKMMVEITNKKLM
jgi:3-polyprenyl-4-hydroxybenzoate decarboxylase